jgi:hypothetical protein
MDPYFHLPVAKRSEVREKLSDLARRNKTVRMLSNLYDYARQVKLSLNKETLPGNANLPLLNRWKHVAGTGLPVLMCKAPGIKAAGAGPRTGEFDYMQYVLKVAGRRSQVALKVIEGADHSFANRAGREAVRLSIDAWLRQHFSIEYARRGLLHTPRRASTDKPKPQGNVLVAPVRQSFAQEG